MKTLMFIKNTIKRAEELLRVGERKKALLNIEPLPLKKVPRALLPQIASIYRRSSQHRQALSLLRPYVQKESHVQKATAQEKVQYAATLMRLDAPLEANKILHKVSPTKEPLQAYFQALIAIRSWDYQKGLQHIKTFLNYLSPHADPYLFYSAKNIMLTCYVFLEQYEEASLLLKELKYLLQKTPFKLIKAFLLLEEGKLLVRTGKIKQAHKLLLRFIACYKKLSPDYISIAEMWLLIAQAKEEQAQRKQDTFSKSLKMRFALFKEKSKKRNSFNTFLDISFYEALLQKRTDLLLPIYFGTHYLSYQKRVLKVLQELNGTPPKTFFFPLGKSLPRKHPLIFQKQTGIFYKSPSTPICSIARPGHLLQRALEILASDFYRPFRTAELFSLLFPEDYYNPESSPTQIRQLIKRLRKKLTAVHLPLEVAYKKHAGYFLTSKKPILIEIPNPLTPPSQISIDPKLEKRLITLFKTFKKNAFTSRQAHKVLQESFRTTSRYLNQGIQHLFLKKMPKRKYQFLKNPSF